mgnify:FL=1
MFALSLTQQGELECILIKSPYTHKAVFSDEKTKEGKRVLIPPVYELQVEYMRLGSDNRTVCARKKGCVIVGNFGTYYATYVRRLVHI